MASNDVVIRVTAKNAVKEGFDLSKREVRLFADEAADIFSMHFGKKMRNLGKQIAGPLSLAARDIGQKMGSEASKELRQTLQAGVERDSKGIGQKIGDILGSSIGDNLSDKLKKSTGDIFKRIREQVKGLDGLDSNDSKDTSRRTKTASRNQNTTTNRSKSGGISKDNDKDRDNDDDASRGFLSRLKSFGSKIGERLREGIGGTLSSFFSGDLITMLVKGLAGGLLVTTLAGAIGAAVTAGLGLALGGGVIAIGIAGALKDPRIKGAVNDLKKKFGEVIAEFGKPFRSPVANFLEKLIAFVDRLSPKLKQLSETFAPVVDQLGDGFIGMLENAMPGILDMVEKSKPLFETIAKHMPEIGKSIGKFFSLISENGDDANAFLTDMLDLIEALIPFIGGVIAAFANMYSTISRVFRNAARAVRNFKDSASEFFLEFTLFVVDKCGLLLAAAARAFSWVPGIGPKLKRAEGEFNKFRHNVNEELSRIRDRNVNVRATLLGVTAIKSTLAGIQAGYASVRGRAHGGITGAANGGVRGGLTWTGERGPELLDLPPGTTVHTAGDSQRMMRQASGGQGGETVVRLLADHTMERTLIGVLFNLLRAEIAAQGGNVQVVLGRSG